MTLSYDKILLRAALCMLTLLLTGACSRRGPVLTFREADDPMADTLADWSGVASGLHAAWGTTDKRYARSVVPCAAESECRLTAWRGERVSAQLVLWSADSVGGVECRIGKFRSDGACLPAGIAQARFVRCSPTRSVRAAATAGTAISLFRSRPTCSTRSAASTWMRAPRVRCG